MNLKNIKGKNVIIEDYVYIHPSVEIISDFIHIKKYTKIEEGFKAHTPEKFIIGECGFIDKNCSIKARSFEAGNYLVMFKDVEIGRGGCTGINSHVKIGNGCMLCEKVMINPSESVTIGNNVGIGTEVHIWTHGSYLDILNGFPEKFESVNIGNNVWLPDRITILPGVKIGNNVVVGIGTLINKDLPDGVLAGGIPVKIIKENAFPKKLSSIERDKLVSKLIKIWKEEIISDKGYNKDDFVISYNSDYNRIYFDDIIFDVENKKIIGDMCDVTEDFRDFLRRRGIKFFTGKPFKSIKSKAFEI